MKDNAHTRQGDKGILTVWRECLCIHLFVIHYGDNEFKKVKIKVKIIYNYVRAEIPLKMFKFPLVEAQFVPLLRLLSDSEWHPEKHTTIQNA